MSIFCITRTIKEKSGRKKLSSNERVKNATQRAITDLNAPNGSRDIPFQTQELGQDGHCPICRFSASFLLKYEMGEGGGERPNAVRQ